MEDEPPALAGRPLAEHLASGAFGRAGGAELAALLADARALAAELPYATVKAMVAYHDGASVRDEDGELICWPAGGTGSWFAAAAELAAGLITDEQLARALITRAGATWWGPRDETLSAPLSR